MNYLEDFKRRLVYKNAAIFVFGLGIMFLIGMVFLDFPLGIALFTGGVFFILAWGISKKYACPKCEGKLNVLKELEEVQYCPHCGEHIYIYEENEDEKF